MIRKKKLIECLHKALYWIALVAVMMMVFVLAVNGIIALGLSKTWSFRMGAIFFVGTPILLYAAYKITDDDFIADLLKAGGWAIGLFVLWFIVIIVLQAGEGETKPEFTSYHTSEDLRRATGVEFPYVVPVDSAQAVTPMDCYTRTSFRVPGGLKQDFYDRLEEACKLDPDCWSKYKPRTETEAQFGNEPGYYYHFSLNARSTEPKGLAGEW